MGPLKELSLEPGGQQYVTSAGFQPPESTVAEARGLPTSVIRGEKSTVTRTVINC